MTIKAQTQTKTVTITFGTFDDGYVGTTKAPVLRTPRMAVPLDDWKDLAEGDYSPRGGTPLRDATALFIRALDDARRENTVTVGLLADESGSMSMNREAVIEGLNGFVRGLAGPVDDDALGKVLCVIFTDGLENASRETTAEALRELIAAREAAGWTFIYLGANQDAWATGAGLGYSGGATGQSVNFVASPVGTRSAFASVAADASAFVADNNAYNAMRANTSKRTLDEEGNESS